jgi:hypothetical protein
LPLSPPPSTGAWPSDRKGKGKNTGVLGFEYWKEIVDCSVKRWVYSSRVDTEEDGMQHNTEELPAKKRTLKNYPQKKNTEELREN